MSLGLNYSKPWCELDVKCKTVGVQPRFPRAEKKYFIQQNKKLNNFFIRQQPRGYARDQVRRWLSGLPRKWKPAYLERGTLLCGNEPQN